LSSMGVRHPNRPPKVFFASTCLKPLIGHRPPPAYRDIGQSVGPHRVKGGVPRGNVLGGRVADVCEANAKLWKQWAIEYRENGVDRIKMQAVVSNLIDRTIGRRGWCRER
jgi:hypothetical protein